MTPHKNKIVLVLTTGKTMPVSVCSDCGHRPKASRWRETDEWLLGCAHPTCPTKPVVGHKTFAVALQRWEAWAEKLHNWDERPVAE